jgi:FeS assembly SUF system protein
MIESPEAQEVPQIPAETAPTEAFSAKAESELENAVVEVLQTVYDPEIPVNIYELGLIYDLDVQATGRVHIQMTLTAPACPVAGTLPGEIQAKVAGVPGVTEAEVELVWEPAWDPSRMSEAARLQLGMF